MSELDQNIDRIFTAYLGNVAQFDETVQLLETVHRPLSSPERSRFFDLLWQKFSAVPISHVTGKRTPHEIVIRACARFGPADTLPARLFAALDWNNPPQMESWAVKVGSEFVHSLLSYKDRFSKAAMEQIKAQIALIRSDKSPELVGLTFPKQLQEVASRLATAVDKINFEDFQRTIAGRKATGSPGRKSPRASNASPAGKYGRWRIINNLPEGGQAHVFLVEDANQEFKGSWVLKRLKNVDSMARRTRFERETQVIQGISHPNVLKVIDSDLTAARPYFVSEFCELGSLLDVGSSNFTGNVKATIDTVLPIVDGLVAVHAAGLVHRDIKPANILIRGDGTPVIGDFGICFVEDGKQITLSDEGVGSKNFIAPEMESGQRDLGDPTDRTDVYCLGKVIYWMLSGGHEFSREDHRKNSLASRFKDQRFEHVHRLLDEMVTREPAKRVRSSQLRGRLEMIASLVGGNYAPLSPSVGIQCRFCGVGKYTPLPSRPGYSIPELGLGLATGTDVRVLWCRHCGHVEIFQFNGIENRDWWNK